MNPIFTCKLVHHENDVCVYHHVLICMLLRKIEKLCLFIKKWPIWPKDKISLNSLNSKNMYISTYNCIPCTPFNVSHVSHLHVLFYNEVRC